MHGGAFIGISGDLYATDVPCASQINNTGDCSGKGGEERIF